MKLMQLGQVKLLLAIAAAAPGLLLVAPTSQAASQSSSLVKQVEGTTAPFIDSEARYNTLERLQSVPIQVQPGLIMQDGGTGKEASDPKSKESKDGKETCESGNCGGLINPGMMQRINPSPMRVMPGMQRSALPTQLLQSQQPII